MGTAADTQMQIRGRQTKILKKDIGHIQVIMLAGVDNEGCGPWFFFYRFEQGGKMTKRICLSLLIGSFLVIVGCGGSKYAESIEVNEKFVQLMEEYVNALENVSSADQVATAMNTFADGMEVLGPKIKELAEKYPELRNSENLPDALKASQKRVEEVGKKMAGAFMKIMPYMRDPAVQDAQKRVSTVMANMA
jgi:hypothetical protein